MGERRLALKRRVTIGKSFLNDNLERKKRSFYGKLHKHNARNLPSYKNNASPREKVVQDELKRANINVEKRSLNAFLTSRKLPFMFSFFATKKTGKFSSVYIAFVPNDKKIKEARRKNCWEKMENKLAFHNKRSRFTP